MILKVNKRFLFIPYIKKIKVNYKQAVVKDVIDFFDKIERKELDISEWIINFIYKYGDKKIDDHDKWQIYIYHEKLWKHIKKTFFKGVFSDSGKKSKDPSPLSSVIAFVSKHWGVNGYDLIHKMTFEELKFYAEGIVWNLNEQSKDWKRRNKLLLLQKKKDKRSDKENQAIKNKLSKIRNYGTNWHRIWIEG